MRISPGSAPGPRRFKTPLPAGTPTGSPPLDALFPGNRASDQSFRLVVRPQAGGDAVRIHLSNLTGTRPVTLDSVFIGTRLAMQAVAPGSPRPLRFGGQDQVTIPPGQDVLSDPQEFGLAAGQDVAISFHLRGQSGPIP